MPPTKTDNEVKPQDKFKTGGELEAAFIFPTTPKGVYRSSYYADSYDFPYNPDPLAAGQYAVYDEMKDDDQVKAAMSIKKDMVINTGWQIVCDNETIKLDLENAIKCVNKGKLYGGFDAFLRDVLSAYEYGFSMSEILFKLDGGKYWPASCACKPPHSFEFDINDFGDVVKVRQVGAQNTNEFAPDYFMHFAYQQEWGNPFGKSDLKSAHAAWKAKKFFIKMFAIYAERFGTPTTVGKYPKNYGTNEIVAFNNVLKTIQNNTTLAVPEDALIEFVQATRDGSDVYTKGMDMFNTWIARSILVPDLLGISGEKTSGGSYSLGDRQFNLFLSTIANDRKILEAKINEKIINPVLIANYGDSVEARFEFLPYSEEDSMEMSKIWADAVKGRIFKASEQEVNHFRRSVGFPEGPVEMVEEPKPEDNPLNKGKEAEEDKEDKKEFSQARTYKRDFTSYEKKVNFSLIEKNLNNSEDMLVPQINRACKLIYSDLIQQIKDKGILRRFDPDKVNAIKPRFQKELNLVFKNSFKELFKQSSKDAQKEIFPSSTKYAMDEDMLPEEFLEVLEAESFKMVGDYSNEISKRTKNKVMQAIKQGVSESELAKILMSDNEDYTDTWAKTVARTKTTEIYNQARKTYWDTDPLASQIIEAYQFSAIMDERTSDVCSKLDGKIFDKGDFTSVITPPLHFNCRSILVPVTKFEEYKPNAPISIDKLQEWGGNLILPDSKKFTAMPNLTATGKAVNIGDNVVIEAAGLERRIKVLSIVVANSDAANKAGIAFRTDSNGDMLYEQTLPEGVGSFNKEFVDGWILEAGKPLILNLSSGSAVSYTIEYIIIDNLGMRIA